MAKNTATFYDYTLFIYDESLPIPQRYTAIHSYHNIQLADVENILTRKGKPGINDDRYHYYFADITDAELQKLAVYAHKQDTLFRQAMLEEEQDKYRLEELGLCPKCGTWCYGACELE